MNITLSSAGNVAVTRGEKITRGQSRSKLIKVNWRLGESPPELNENHISADSLVVQVNITRPDGEYSGWQDMIKVDGEISYYYPLQKWDTEVSGKAQCQIRWFKAGDDGDDDDTTVQTSNQVSFVIDNGAIAQTLLPTLADYTTWQALIVALQNSSFRKYNVNDLPDGVVYNVNGNKSAPAIFYNSTHTVTTYNTSTQTSASQSITGMLIVGNDTSELLIANGRLYFRKRSSSLTFSDLLGELEREVDTFIANKQNDVATFISSNQSDINSRIRSAQQQITQIISDAQRVINSSLTKNDIRNNLTTNYYANGYVLSAYQGYVLKSLVDTINSKIPTAASANNKLVDKLTVLEALNSQMVAYTVDVDSIATVSWYVEHNYGTLWVNWGDGSIDEIDTTSTANGSRKNHTYATAGEYTIKVYGITTINEWLRITPAAKTIVISNGITSIEDNAFGDAVAGNTSLEKVIIGDDVASIGQGAFYNCTNLSYVKIGNGCKTIGNRAFRECNIQQLIIGESIESIGESIMQHVYTPWPVNSKITIMSETPPEINISTFTSSKVSIYVPSLVVDDYKTAFGAVDATLRNRIYPIDNNVVNEIKTWANSNFAPINLAASVSGIAEKIPAQASSENQLADKAYVETLVAQNGSHFLGTFESVPALRTGTASTATNNDYANVINSVLHFQTNDLMNSYPKDRLTNKDYAVVNQASDTGPVYDYNYYIFNIETQTWTWIAGFNLDTYDKFGTYYNRYTYNAETSSWEWNFTINNMSLSANQIDALNSGITATKVSDYDTHIANKNNPHAVSKAQIGLANVENERQYSANNPNFGTATPVMDGIGSAGSATTYSHSDHVHPSDTSKQDVIDANNKLNADYIADGTTNKVFTATEQSKLNGIENGAEVNTVDSVNEKTGEVVLDADDISDVNTTKKFVTENEKNTWNAKQNALTFDSTPTAGSTNPVTSEGIKNAIDSAVSSVYRYKGSVATYADLPSIGLTAGDVYNVEDTGDNYAWTGTAWDKLAGTIDLSGYVPTSRTIAGLDLSQNRTASELLNALFEVSVVEGV